MPNDKEFINSFIDSLQNELLNNPVEAKQPNIKTSGTMLPVLKSKIDDYRTIFRKSKKQLTPTDATNLNQINLDLQNELEQFTGKSKKIDSLYSSLPRKFYPNQSKTGYNLLNTLDSLQKNIEKEWH